jgi:general secretion pathway protein K
MNTMAHPLLHEERGFALAVVLWLVALLSMMALSLGAMQRTETTAAANLLEGARARAAAQAGIQLAILDMMRAPAVRQLTLDGEMYESRYGDAVLRISAMDEAGKVDLNFAPGPLLDELLRAAGMEEETDRLHLVDAILDWRDTDELKRIHGAERDEYQAAGLGYAPRNAPFQSIEELSLVLGMSAPLYHRIAGSITIFTGASGINTAASAINRLSIKAEMDDEQEPLAEALPNDAEPSADRSVEGGRVVTIRCEAQQPGGVRESLEAVVRFTPRRGNAAVHYEMLVWRERPAAIAVSSSSQSK